MAECEALGTITKKELQRLEWLSELRSIFLTPPETIAAHKRMMKDTARLLREFDEFVKQFKKACDPNCKPI